MKDIIRAFPGYEFVMGEDKKMHNMYRDTDLGFGGYIKSFPGIYTDVALLDVASLHPNSIRAMNCFGDYTKNFTDILDARVAIKHKDFDSAKKMAGGKLEPYLQDPSSAKQLAQALKIAINSVYGLTSASFDNPFRDVRNKNNIVALRGALFMRTLQDEVEAKGFKIVAIKTDSIKIANATKDIIDFCMEFANKYGYTFEHEATYDRICQVNDADYIAMLKDPDWCMKTYGYVPGDNTGTEKWTTTGAKFSVPYVFKTLFSHEPIIFSDMCEVKSVQKGALYLDFNEDKPENEHSYHFVGRVGQFTPIKPGCGGGELLRVNADKYYSATGAKGYRWMESNMVQDLKKEKDIDRSYYDELVNDSVKEITKYGDFEMFVNADIFLVSDELPKFEKKEEELTNE